LTEFKALAFTIIECYKCHVQFCITNEHNENLLERKTEFFCPNGHGQVYTGKSDKQKVGELRQKINVCSLARRELSQELDKKINQLRHIKCCIAKRKRKHCQGVIQNKSL